MALVAIIFSFAVSYIAYRGVQGSTNVAIVINAVQIAALLFFSALAIAYRVGIPMVRRAWHSLAQEDPSLQFQPGTIRRIPAPFRSLRRIASAGDAPGHNRYSPAGRLRIGNVAGRRSHEPQEGYPPRRSAVADHPGPVLLLVRVLRGQLLPEQRLQPGDAKAPQRQSAT